MNILICPDKFKGTLSALEAARAIARGVNAVLPDADIVLAPIADGGEGTVAAAVAAGAELRSQYVTGPLGAPVHAEWAWAGNGTAVLEAWAASGLHLVDPNPDGAGQADTRGTGELLRAALDAGATRIILGLGGVATTDGGSGLLAALGAILRDANGEILAPGGLALAQVANVDVANLDPRLRDVEIVLACDVDSPLVGDQGAAAVFAPQKGADPETVNMLESALQRWATVLLDQTGVRVDVPGAGAAGGIPAALRAFTPARFASGFDTVAEMVGLPGRIANAQLLITGEGSLDAQSLAGKGPVAVAAAGRDGGAIPLAVAGRITLTAAQLAQAGFAGASSLVQQAGSSAAAMADPARYAEMAGEAVVREWLARRDV